MCDNGIVLYLCCPTWRPLDACGYSVLDMCLSMTEDLDVAFY